MNVLYDVPLTSSISNRIPACEPPQLRRVEAGPNLVPRAWQGAKSVSYSVSRGFCGKQPATIGPRAPAREELICIVKELRSIVPQFVGICIERSLPKPP